MILLHDAVLVVFMGGLGSGCFGGGSRRELSNQILSLGGYPALGFHVQGGEPLQNLCNLLVLLVFGGEN